MPLIDAAFNPLEEVPFETRSDLNGSMEQSINSQLLRLGYRGEGYEVVSVTARRHWKIDPFLADTDLTPLPLAVLELRENQEQWLEEFRIRSTADDSAWNQCAGLFFFALRVFLSYRFFVRSRHLGRAGKHVIGFFGLGVTTGAFLREIGVFTVRFQFLADPARIAPALSR